MIYIHIQILKELRDELLNEANSMGMSMAAYVRFILINRKKVLKNIER